jgi:hypothetical protein
MSRRVSSADNAGQGLAKREREGLDAGIEEFNLKGLLLDKALLSAPSTSESTP